MVGEHAPGFVLVKSVGLFAVSLALVTWIGPLVAPATVAQISVAETILNDATCVPPISTLETTGLSKFVPLITTTQPAGPLVGENDAMVGGSADAGVSTPTTIQAAATPSPTKRRTRFRFGRFMPWSSRSALLMTERLRQARVALSAREGLHPGSRSWAPRDMRKP